MPIIRRRFLTTSVGALCALLLVLGIPSTSAPIVTPSRSLKLESSRTLHYPWAGEYGPISMSANPSVADRDINVTITVTIERPAPSGGATVTLTNNDALQFSSWTSQITIPAGSTTGSATARTSHWGSGSLVTLTATCSGESMSTTLQTLGSIIGDN
jgi:hypothetical protein